MSRWRAIAGIAGPVAFATAWAALGTDKAGYSPVHDPISRLAAVDSSTRGMMTAGLLAFGSGVWAYARDANLGLPSKARTALKFTAVAAFGIAATPLGSAIGGRPHAGWVAVAYTSLVAAPALSARAFRIDGRHAAATASTITAIASGTALFISVLGVPRDGFWQRTGLTIGHAWIAATAFAALRGRLHRPALRSGQDVG